MDRAMKFRSKLGTHVRRRGATRKPDGEGAPRDQLETPSTEQTPETATSRPPGSRLAGVVAVTLIEGASIYAWLYLDHKGEPWWGLLALVVGEMIETAFLTRFVDRGGVRRWGPLTRHHVTSGHLRRVQWRLGFAGNAETAIWVLWLLCAIEYSQEVAAVALLVAMHLKHQAEIAAVRDHRYRVGLFAPTSLLGSAMEVAGAVACLALILDGQYVLAAIVLGAGLLVEHALLIEVLSWEITWRDIRLPRDARWRRPKRPAPAMVDYATSHFEAFWRVVQRSGALVRLGNRVTINRLIKRIEPRPNPLSTMVPYTCWASLTDRTFSGRHLPPVSPGSECPPTDGPPTSTAVANAFLRDKFEPCPKTTVLFTFFAQWFTDGILRTERPSAPTGVHAKPTIRNTRKNESNHDVDLATLYGLTRAATDQLRTGVRGRRGLLKSQQINGEEYPPYYHVADRPGGELRSDPQFDKLPPPLTLGDMSYEQKRTLFAMGTDTRNIGFITLNVLFLREHNRIARRLGDENPSWDSDQVFETTRSILIVLLIKLVVEEYINHINPSYFRFRLLPGAFPNEPWHRPNWVAIEFNLLYRWHALVPSTFELGGRRLPLDALLSDTSVLTSTGLGHFLAAASSQPAGKMCLFNTDKMLVAHAEKASIEQGRVAGLASYNDYRRLCRHAPAASFADISSDPRVQQRLAELYPGGVEDVEFYIGLFAEDLEPNNVLPPLMMTMVAFDAFSQALTNPLLGPRVFNADTFTQTGMEIIEDTTSLSDIVQRNVPPQPEPHFVSMTRRGYRRV